MTKIRRTATLLATSVLVAPLAVYASATAHASTPAFRVATPSGAPVINAVVTLSRYRTGDASDETTLATAPVGADGGFTVPPGVVKAASVAHVNIDLQIASSVDGRLLYDQLFDQGLPTSLTAVAHGSRATLATASSRKLRRAMQGVARYCGGAGGGWVTVYNENHNAIVGEPHARYDVTVDYKYLSDNTTSLGVGITYDAGASWSASGNVSVNKSSTASSSTDIGAKGPYWAAYEMGQFQEYHQHWINSCGQYLGEVRVVPHAWTGQLTQGASTGQYDGSGTTIYQRAVANGWRQWYGAHYTFVKVTGSTSSYAQGFNIGPINLNSATDHNTEVTYTWQFGSASTHYLMGGDNVTSLASIVYSW